MLHFWDVSASPFAIAIKTLIASGVEKLPSARSAGWSPTNALWLSSRLVCHHRDFGVPQMTGGKWQSLPPVPVQQQFPALHMLEIRIDKPIMTMS